MAEDLYLRLLAINRQTFEAGAFDAAYHALVSALYCARDMATIQPLKQISQVALKELAWIDEHHPEYEHSSQSTAERGLTPNIFEMLSHQAETSINIRTLNDKLNNSQ